MRYACPRNLKSGTRKVLQLISQPISQPTQQPTSQPHRNPHRNLHRNHSATYIATTSRPTSQPKASTPTPEHLKSEKLNIWDSACLRNCALPCKFAWCVCMNLCKCCCKAATLFPASDLAPLHLNLGAAIHLSPQKTNVSSSLTLTSLWVWRSLCERARSPFQCACRSVPGTQPDIAS